MAGAPAVELLLPPWRAERILYDRDGLLVVDKPIGIPVYGGAEGLQWGATDRLAAHLTISGRSTRLGVHQRLDQATSGVLLFTTDPARDPEVAGALEARTLKRSYVAVCSDPSGRLGESGTIRLRLERAGARSRVTRRGGKEALTDYRVTRRSGQRALVELSLQTGRLHQIRVSLAHLGAPVVGDELYGGEAAERLFLHATRLSGGPLESPIDSHPGPRFSDALFGRPPQIPQDPEAALRDALSLRAPLREVSSAFRLVNGEGDGLPGITIDNYCGFAVINVYDEGWLEHRQLLTEALRQVGCLGVYEKRRLRTDLRTVAASDVAPERPVWGQVAPEELLVREGSLSLLVNLSDGLSTGLFVDQRDNHQKTLSWCAGGRVLNLFCYTGAFSVAAALAGAHVSSVDLSAKALARCKRNFELNDLAPSDHRFIKEDAMKYLSRAVRREERYDFIVLDPPSFSTVGKGTFSVRGRYQEAATACVAVLSPGGKLLCVTNHNKTSLGQLRAMLEKAAASAGRAIRSLRVLPSGLDCPRGSSGPFPSKSVIVEVQ